MTARVRALNLAFWKSLGSERALETAAGYSRRPMGIPRALMEAQHMAQMQQQAAAERENEELEAFLLLLAGINSGVHRFAPDTTLVSDTVERDGA